MKKRSLTALQRSIEDAIAENAMRLGLKRLPLLPSRAVIRLMAEAAISVYAAAVCESGSRSQQDSQEGRPPILNEG